MSTVNRGVNTSQSVDLGAFAPEQYCHVADVVSDSNQLAGGCRVGTPDKLVIREGGADNQTDTGQSGGRSIA